MDKKDLYIKAKLQKDKNISSQANEIFKKFEGGINLENNNEPKERKVIKISLKQAVLAFTSLIVVVVLGGNLYAHLNGKPNLYSAIKGLFIKEAKYTESEIAVDQTVESNGIKLTLKTVAMDENVLITKYVAEGEKLENEFYTYNELEEAEIEINKIRYVQAGNDIGESGYEKYTSNDVTKMRKEIVSKLQKAGLELAEAQELEQLAKEAYQAYIGAQIGIDGSTDEKAKELIEQVIAMFEAKVSSRYQIMQSQDTLQNIKINVISQNIEKSGNSYIIYNIYNVDTITDLASKFDLIVKVNKIGNIEGKWNFETKLEKARLDTRVETIDFYENNSCSNVAPTITEDKVRHVAIVEAKRLVISDFSTVLMIQTRVPEVDREYYLKYADSGLPCVFVITDENGNTVGTGTLSQDEYEAALNAGGEIKYTERILLENVGKDTKKLYVKMYEQYTIEEEPPVLDALNAPIVLDIEAARNGKKPVELTQSYASKNVQVSFKYPGDWKVEEADGKITITSPENVDGEVVKLIISKKEEEKTAKEIVDEKISDLKKASYEYTSGTKTILGTEGYYYTVDFGADIGTLVLVNRENDLYGIEYAGIETQYTRYEETFNKILETIEFVESEKSYVEYYMDNSSESLETVKIYEDNTATVQVTQTAIDKFSQYAHAAIEANVEYQITGVNAKIIDVDLLTGLTWDIVPSYGYCGSYMFIYGENKEVYLLDMYKGISTKKFEAIKLKIDTWFRAEVEDLPFFSDKQIKVVTIQDENQWTYVVSRDGTLEKYTGSEHRLPTPSKYEDMSYKSFTISSGVIKQYEDNTVTIKWDDGIIRYKDKLLAVEPNVEYTITGLDGNIKAVYNVIKDRQEINMPAIKIVTENGTMYGTMELRNEGKIEASMVDKIADTETILQQRADCLNVITKSNNVYNVQYNLCTLKGKAPSKQTIYNCVSDYCESSTRLAINESIEDAFEFITYIEDENSNYKADARVKIYDSSLGEEKIMQAVVVYDTQNNNFKVESFDENPKGSGGY